MSKTPRERAEACFAVARSTTHDGERANSISLGTRIAEKAGLSLDLFDIPGRVKAKPKMSGKRGDRVIIDDPYAPFHEFGTRRARTPSAEAEAQFNAQIKAMRERMFGDALRGGSTLWGDTIPPYSRNPSDAAREFREAEERLRAQANPATKSKRVLDAVSVIRETGALVDPIPADQGGGWAIRLHDGMGTATDDMVLELARKVRLRQARA